MPKIKYIFKHWKLGYHILVRTKRFGVNNRRWENFDALYGMPIWKQLVQIITIFPLIRNYKRMKVRAIYLGFLHPDTVRLLWGKHPWFN